MVVAKYSIIIVLIFFNRIADASFDAQIENFCPECKGLAGSKTATVILDKGNTALLSRAWLTRNAQRSIDIQYFIWSHDNVGILAAAELLAAADRGVAVRVIVDDFLVNTDLRQLAALDQHPYIQIKIYNPLHHVGVSKIKRVWHLLTKFRNFNQRMHDKLAVFDGDFAITGGRNMADEYFDFNKDYAFRDRDVLVYGQALESMQQSFERFWAHDLAKPLTALLAKEINDLTETERHEIYQKFRDYARDENNFLPEVRSAINKLNTRFPLLAKEKVWSDAEFFADLPGKNSGGQGLQGGGITSSKLYELMAAADDEILIQSPYMVVPKDIVTFFAQRVQAGVSIKLSTNSLASTDNLLAYSGYHNVRDDLLKAGVQIFEYKPEPKNFAKLYLNSEAVSGDKPTFAIHAKSMVIDKKMALIGTFNFDPRSIHLNTEVALMMPDEAVATELKMLIEDDMNGRNSWQVTSRFNADRKVTFAKRLKLSFLKLLPLEAIL